MKRSLLLLFVLIFYYQFTINTCFAQSDCIDSLYINPNPSCGTLYEPICACNGNTYRNQCFATSDGVIPGQFIFGPCEPLHYYFYPTYAVDFLNISFGVKVESYVNLYIFDAYGNIKFFQDYYVPIPYILNLPNFDISTLNKGVYILVAETQGYYKRQKFVKINHGDN